MLTELVWFLLLLLILAFVAKVIGRFRKPGEQRAKLTWYNILDSKLWWLFLGILWVFPIGAPIVSALAMLLVTALPITVIVFLAQRVSTKRKLEEQQKLNQTAIPKKLVEPKTHAPEERNTMKSQIVVRESVEDLFALAESTLQKYKQKINPERRQKELQRTSEFIESLQKAKAIIKKKDFTEDEITTLLSARRGVVKAQKLSGNMRLSRLKGILFRKIRAYQRTTQKQKEKVKRPPIIKQKPATPTVRRIKKKATLAYASGGEERVRLKA